MAILTETANTLRTKFEWSEYKTQQLLRAISKTATVVKSQPHIHLLKDEPDNRILECALLTRADLIVTGDQHLLSLREYRNISIIKLADFIALVRQP